ncbi:hypothetical protein D3C87_1610800 [compost metagenome]
MGGLNGDGLPRQRLPVGDKGLIEGFVEFPRGIVADIDQRARLGRDGDDCTERQSGDQAGTGQDASSSFHRKPSR